MTRIVQESRAAWAAVVFFTRIRLPEIPGLAADDLRRASTYFPLVGWLVGGIAAATWWTASLSFSPGISSGLCLAATLLATGAMHEDGLADFCDGFGGGTTRGKILEIMQDSRVGSFGVIGLVLILGLKWRLIAEMPTLLTIPAMLVSQSLSRFTAISLMAGLPYVREGPAKARPLTSRLRGPRLFLVLFFGFVPLLLLPVRLWWCSLVALAIHAAARSWLKSKIGGYTGDCLGAVQQVAEASLLLALVAMKP